MNKKQKAMLARIIVAFIIYILAIISEKIRRSGEFFRHMAQINRIPGTVSDYRLGYYL